MSFLVKYSQITVVALGMALFHANNVASAEPAEAFQQGLKAYRAGNYLLAVDLFQKAGRDGLVSSTLHYNLAVSYFKLKDYPQARIWFKRAAEDSKLEYLSIYNLGLLAIKMKQTDQALDHFINVAENAGEDRLVKLANYQIDKILEPSSASAPSSSEPLSGTIFAQLEFGHDSNVRGSEDTSPSKKASDYFDTYLFAAMRLAGVDDHELLLKGFILDSQYKSVPSEDFQLRSLGLEQSFITGAWRNALGVDYLVSTLNGRAFQNTLVYEARTKYSNTSIHEFRLRYRYYDIESEAPYQELSGSKQRTRLEYRANFPADKFRLYYEFEHNDRSETRTGNNFSPIRHTLRTAYTLSLSENFKLKVDLAYRHSIYSTKSGATVRTEDRTSSELELAYHLNQNWFLSASYKQVKNDSSQLQYRYQREVTSASINMIF